MKYSFPKILEILVGGKGQVLATIVEVKGSAPQVAGATAVFSDIGLVAGTVGGGLIEAKATEIAARCLEDRRGRLETFRLDADSAAGEGAICGGEAAVLFDPRVEEEKPVFEAVLEALKGREPGVLLTRVAPPAGDAVTISRTHLTKANLERTPRAGPIGDHEFEVLIQSGKPLLKREAGALLFLEPVSPLPRLIVAGAGHVGRAVARLGSLLDFEVTVVDDRPEFANAANVPDADTLIVGEFEESIRGIPSSPDDYFVIVTRGHRNDAEALRPCLKRGAAYVGMIGSKTKVALMKKEFLGRGWATAREWDRIHAPIGLEIGSQTVEEIAVSIAAELVLVRAGRGMKEKR